jgi:NOL1/NOP2/fmu family ribosome biogenesis protein
MQKLKILNNKEIKKIRQSLVREFGYFWQGDYAYLMNEKDRLYLINKDIGKIDLKKLRIDKLGLYVAEVKNGQVRLSKEGAQFLVKEAKENNIQIKNLLELTQQEVKAYFYGVDLRKDLGEDSKLVILQYEDNIIGCARYKEGKILNFLPKMNRGEVIL